MHTPCIYVYAHIYSPVHTHTHTYTLPNAYIWGKIEMKLKCQDTEMNFSHSKEFELYLEYKGKSLLLLILNGHKETIDFRKNSRKLTIKELR